MYNELSQQSFASTSSQYVATKLNEYQSELYKINLIFDFNAKFKLVIWTSLEDATHSFF